MKKIIYIFLLLLLGIGIGYLLFNPTPTPIPELNFAKPTPTPIVMKMEKTPEDFYASFGIFTLNVPRTFNNAMYHNRSDIAIIEPEQPNLVRVKKAGTTWDQFFKTLPFFLTKECLTTGTNQNYCTDEFQKLQFYVNGVEDPDALDKVIRHGDKLLITYGKEPSEAFLRSQLDQIPTVE